MKIYYVPIEPLEERYTEQWYRHFPIEFKKAGFEVEIIDGVALSDTVDVGTFLDINSTIAYKNSQMTKIASMFRQNLIEQDSIFFFGDTEFWGLESLRLMADMNKVNIKVYSFLHAGSYTLEDAFQIAEPYQKYTELGWIMACDKVFVGTEYHKEAFIERRINRYADEADKQMLSDKIFVSGNPVFLDEYDKFDTPKKQKIIISNRFDVEKRPNLSLDFAYLIKKRHPEVEIVITTSRDEFKSNAKWLVEYAKAYEEDGIVTIKAGLSKNDYHKELSESKIMLTNSIEENFGYCILEALVYDTYPLCPVGLSHNELCSDDERLLFKDNDEILDKIEMLLSSDFSVTDYAKKYESSIEKIIKTIKGENE